MTLVPLPETASESGAPFKFKSGAWMIDLARLSWVAPIGALPLRPLGHKAGPFSARFLKTLGRKLKKMGENPWKVSRYSIYSIDTKDI
jgi:hypothetical protein